MIPNKLQRHGGREAIGISEAIGLRLKEIGWKP
jgi:hypothetical protein